MARSTNISAIGGPLDQEMVTDMNILHGRKNGEIDHRMAKSREGSGYEAGVDCSISHDFRLRGVWSISSFSADES